MTDQITQLFNYLGNQVRVVTIKGEPWFVAADIGDVLGFVTNAGASVYTGSLEDHEKTTPAISLGSTRISFNNKTLRNTTVLISESGLYKLVMRANRKNPAALQFQNWVTGTVLPTLRKDKQYNVGEEKVLTGEMTMEEMTLMVINNLQGKAKRLEAERDAALETVAQQDERLNFITVAEYLALSKHYMPHIGPCGRPSTRSALLARPNGH